MAAELPIFVHQGIDNWESRIIRGALLYHGITSKVCDLSSIDEFDDDLYVVLPSRKDQSNLANLCHANKTLLLAGRHITLQHLHSVLSIPDNVIIVYGEPYRTIPQLIRNKALMAQSRGKAIMGALYDPREYTAVPGTCHTDTSLVVTSVGCTKKCAYCTYGCTYSRLYGNEFSRRSRPWQDIENELIASLDKDVDRFHMTADQFLSNDPEENLEIRSLAFNWNSGVNGRPCVVFTVSPVEVRNNRPIIDAMSRAFRVYPRLSIDSFDDRALALFDRDYDAAVAMEALEFLAALKLPLKVNYIFMRPGIDLASIDKEIPYLKRLASVTSYLSVYEKLLLAYDIFSSNLLVYEAAPIAFEKGIRNDYESELSLKMLTIMSSIQDNLEKMIADVRKGKEKDPLMSLMKALEGEVKQVLTGHHDLASKV